MATIGSFAYCSREGSVAASPAAGLERRREGSDRVQVARTRAIPLDLSGRTHTAAGSRGQMGTRSADGIEEELEAFLGPPRHALRARLLWRMLYETAARAQQILLLDVGDLNPAHKRAMVIGKGGNAEPIGWETRHRPAAPSLPRRAERRVGLHLRYGLSCPVPSEVFRTASVGWILHLLHHSGLMHLTEAVRSRAVAHGQSPRQREDPIPLRQADRPRPDGDIWLPRPDR